MSAIINEQLPKNALKKLWNHHYRMSGLIPGELINWYTTYLVTYIYKVSALITCQISYAPQINSVK